MTTNERREERGEKSSDDNGDYDDDKTEEMDNNDKMGKMDDKIKTIPEQFQSYSNLEICNWLVSHPHILRLANQMLEMSKSDEPSLDTSIVASSSTSSSSGNSGGITDVSIKSIWYNIYYV